MVGEAVLDYWREDYLLAHHHEHWHMIYPYTGSKPNPEGGRSSTFKAELKRMQSLAQSLSSDIDEDARRWNTRHGELFAYMHQQLLARYDAERLCFDLPPVAPLKNFSGAIAEGYPGSGPIQHFTADSEPIRLAARSAGKTIKDITDSNFLDRPGRLVANQHAFGERLLNLATNVDEGFKFNGINELAERIEPTARFQSPYFGAYHNDGHLLLSLNSDGNGGKGPLFWEAAAIKDPIFYRWHRNIDNIFEAYEETLPPHVFRRLPSIEIVSAKVISENAVDVLMTEVNTLSYPLGPTANYHYNYISHDPFSIEVRLKNKQKFAQSCVMRFFICPTEQVHDRKFWIEMDKWLVEVPGETTAKLSRSDRDFSTVRRPIVDKADIEAARVDINRGSTNCLCGWPYTMLVPRGKEDGMAFTAFYMITPGEDVDGHTQAGDSYCGRKNEEYPDKREMGFPFNRRMSSKLENIVSKPGSYGQFFTTELTIYTRG